MADEPVSPVLIRITSSMVVTNIFPSPIFSVLADFEITSIISATLGESVSISNLILGSVSIAYSAPLYSSV